MQERQIVGEAVVNVMAEKGAEAVATSASVPARVAAIVVSYRTGPVLARCLESLLIQPEIQELLIVDNGNDAATVAWLAQLERDERRVRAIRPARNIGFAAGCNLGAASARSDYFAFVNPDTIIPPGTFAKVLDIFAQRPDAWLCGGRLLNMDGSEQRGGRREILSPWRALVEMTRLNRLFPNHPLFRRLHLCDEAPETGIVEVPTVSGAFMVIPRSRYEAVGGMDDNIFLHFDDADLCIRVARAGGKILYCGTVPIYHHLSTSAVTRTFIEWHKTRSTSYYFYKHFHGTHPWWLLLLTSALLWLRFLIIAVCSLPRDLVRKLRQGGAAQAGASSQPMASAPEK